MYNELISALKEAEERSSPPRSGGGFNRGGNSGGSFNRDRGGYNDRDDRRR